MRRLLLLLSCLGLAACASLNPFSEPAPVYVVFFDGHTVALTADAKQIVSRAASAARAHPKAMVQIAGPSTKIAPGYNPRYAQPRIDAVTAELAADGVGDTRIVQTSLTTDKVKVDASGAQRVEIRIIQPHG